MNSVTKLVAVAAAVLLVGCSDGGVGENKLVRFSQVVNFVETDDFTAPMAQGRSVLIRLERAQGQLLRERGYPELSLEVTGGTSQLLPLGFGQYAVRLDEERAYRFVAKDGDKAIDAITVNAKPASSIRVSAKARVLTSSTVNGKSCVSAADVDAAEVTLAPNQEAAFFVVPLDASKNPMLGFLQLTAKTGREDLELDTPIFFEGGSPNALMVKPKNIATDKAELEIREATLGTITVPLKFSTTPATATCP